MRTSRLDDTDSLALQASEHEPSANELPEMNRVTLLKKKDATVTMSIDSPRDDFLCWKLWSPSAPRGEMARAAPIFLDGFASLSARRRSLSTFHFSKASPMPSGMIISIATRKM